MSLTLSATLCNYNHGHYVGRAIQAMVGQSRPPDELIILDDGSTDHSVEIISEYAGRYPYIRLLRNETNLGVLAAIEKVVGAATCDCLYGGAADDYVLPGFFERAMSLLECHRQAGCFVAAFECEFPKGSFNRKDTAGLRDNAFTSGREFYENVLREAPITFTMGPCTLFRRAALDAVGGFRRELGAWCDTFAGFAAALRQGVCYSSQPCLVVTPSEQGFSRSFYTDVTRSVCMIEKASALMRSPEFCGVFPEEYVCRFEREFWDFIAATCEARLHDLFCNVRQFSLNTVKQTGGPGRFVSAGLCALSHASEFVTRCCMNAAIDAYYRRHLKKGLGAGRL